MNEPLVIACVKWGEQYGAYYVNALCDMVRRNVPRELSYSFQCFTDDPAGLHPGVAARELPGDLTGWWNKLYLFKEGLFAPNQRIAYFDLDTLIVGPLDSILNYRGDFALLRDFYRPHGYGSGVMLWRAEACYSLWSRFAAEGRPVLDGGDQAWVEKAYPDADLLQDCFPGSFASYKADCHPLPPEGTSVVCFHGEPKQDNCDAPWVREIWKPGGALRVNPRAVATAREEMLANARHAEGVPYPWLEDVPAHGRCAAIIGGGPSLDECEEELRRDRQQGYDFFAINNAPAWLGEHGIGFDAQVICGAREEHAAFVPENAARCYCASTCHPAVLAKAGRRAVLWHPDTGGMKDASATGLKAIHLAYLLGYRSFHLYGFDSCCLAGAHHAYLPPEGDRDRVFAVELCARRFHVAAWMLRQAKEFVPFVDRLLRQGCSIAIHGDGLLHFLATQVEQSSQVIQAASSYSS